MKSLYISTAFMVALLMSWSIFANYADNSLHSLSDQTENHVLAMVKDEDWPKAQKEMEILTKAWHHHKKTYSFFFKTSALNDTDFSIAKAGEYIFAKDSSNSAGELACIKEQLTFLHSNETFTLDNIF